MPIFLMTSTAALAHPQKTLYQLFSTAGGSYGGTMRLNSFYRKAITTVFYDVFRTGSIYLFGSRVDDSRKGGDIDLYLEIDEEPTFEKKIKFLSRLKRIIGEQKIDTVFNTDAARPIEEEIRKWAVKL